MLTQQKHKKNERTLHCLRMHYKSSIIHSSEANIENPDAHLCQFRQCQQTRNLFMMSEMCFFVYSLACL